MSSESLLRAFPVDPLLGGTVRSLSESLDLLATESLAISCPRSAAPRKIAEHAATWGLPSDHSPVAAHVDLSSRDNPLEIIVASWNVLNSAYIEYLKPPYDGQQLNGSMLTELNHTTGRLGLTEREALVLLDIDNMLDNGVSLMGLQECGTQFTLALISTLKKRHGDFELVLSSRTLGEDQGVVIFDTRTISLVTEHSRTVFPYKGDSNYIMDLEFVAHDGGRTFRFRNTHVPGGPVKGPDARLTLAGYLAEERPALPTEESDTIPSVLVGDMNVDVSELEAIFSRAMTANPVWVSSPFYSHVNTESQAVTYDGIFVSGPAFAQSIAPTQLLKNPLPRVLLPD